MNKLFCLSNVSIEQLPADLAGQACLSAPELSSHQLPALTASYEALIAEDQAIPNIIIGSYQTPVLQWISAQRAFPDAMSLCYEGDESGVWRDLNSSDVWGASVEDAPENQEIIVETPAVVAEVTSESVVTEQPIEAVSIVMVQPKDATETPKIAQLKDLTDKQILQALFVKTVWNEPVAVERLQQEVRNRHLRNPNIVAQAEERLKHANIAINMGNQAKNRLKKQLAQNPNADTKEVLAWLAEQPFWKIGHIKNHITITLNKELAYRKTQNAKHNASKKQPKQATNLAVISFSDHHPNSLRHLKPSQQWTVVIDETGKVDASSLDLSYNNKNFGKVAALVIPQRAEKMLPPIPGHHATSATDAKNDKVVESILKADVGVFGFTIRDEGLEVKQVWFDSISRLVNWVMLLLPIQSGEHTYVKFMIEQQGGHSAKDYDLKIVAEEVTSRLRSIDSERFARTTIDTSFIDKEGSAFNGYVDTIAHAWGSEAPATKQRLKASKWENNCLIRPDQQAVERVYLAATAKRELSADDWYDACKVVADEPESSLLHGFLGMIGQAVQKNNKLWQTYMNHVTDRLRTKNFRNNDLAQALDWLQKHQPEGQQLSAMTELQWRSAKLAQDNHQGKIEPQEIGHVFKLANALRNESAVDSAQAILRVVTATTNAFEFDSALPALQQWVKEDIAVVGLLNHAKLHSTLGQLSAFKQDNEQAISHFDQAIGFFKQMSDQGSVRRDIAQTTTYKIIAMMDNGSSNEQVLPELWSLLAGHGTDTKQMVQRLSISDEEDKNAVFHHFLLLRAMVHYPQSMQAEIDTYLSNENNWLVYDSHPWQWISAYRGWLLVMRGKQAKAQQYFDQAIDVCEDQGVTMQWIASVISMMAFRLDVNCHQKPLTADYLTALQAQLPKAPFAQLVAWHEDKSKVTHDSILNALKICTPFNFH